MLANMSPLLMLGVLAMGLLGLALLFVFGRVIWMEYFQSDGDDR